MYFIYSHCVSARLLPCEWCACVRLRHVWWQQLFFCFTHAHTHTHTLHAMRPTSVVVSQMHFSFVLRGISSFHSVRWHESEGYAHLFAEIWEDTPSVVCIFQLTSGTHIVLFSPLLFRLSCFVAAIAIGDLVKSTLGPKGMVGLAPRTPRFTSLHLEHKRCHTHTHTHTPCHSLCLLCRFLTPPFGFAPVHTGQDPSIIQRPKQDARDQRWCHNSEGHRVGQPGR